MVGNCQASAIAQAMRLLLPRAAVSYERTYGRGRRFAEPDAVARRFAGYDAVFCQTSVLQSHSAPLDGVPITPIPIIVFAAFHPDLVYVGGTSDDGGPRQLRSPLGRSNYHSALALFGFRAGLSATETERLFEPETFERLGYAGLWTAASDGLLMLGRQAMYDLSDDLLRWSRRGIFMHSTNHPRMFVACDLARGLLSKAGIPFGDLDLDGCAIDELLPQGAWPLYPGIAEIYGARGGYVFVHPAARGPGQVFDLPGFVEASFAIYAKARRADLACPRVDAWQDSEAVRTELLTRAGR